MDEVNKIKKAFKNGKNVNDIAKEFRRSWATVNTYISLTPDEILKRGIRNRANTVITKNVLERVNEFLDDEIAKKVHRKQRYTATFIFNRLVEEKIYKGSKRHLSEIVTALRKSRDQLKTKKQSFLELDFKLGHYLQIDHGPADVVLNGIRANGHLFVASIPGASIRFCQLYLTKASDAWGMFHEEVFSYFKGVFRHCIYDNDSVLKVPSTGEETSFAIELQEYYDFKAIYCNKGEGHEKGAVEGSVGFCRRNFMAGLPEFETLESCNEYLKRECGEHLRKGKYYKNNRSLKDLLEEVKPQLKPMPHAKEWGKWESLVVDKFQCIQFDGYRYSVPESYLGQKLQTFITVSNINIYNKDDELVISHLRHYVEDHDSLELDHYLDQLLRKPRAVSHAKVLNQATFSDNVKAIRNRLLYRLDTKEANIEFIKILILQRGVSARDFEYALEIALSYGGINSSAINSIIKMLHSSSQIKDIPKNEIPENCDVNISKQFNLNHYDSLPLEN